MLRVPVPVMSGRSVPSSMIFFIKSRYCCMLYDYQTLNNFLYLAPDAGRNLVNILIGANLFPAKFSGQLAVNLLYFICKLYIAFMQVILFYAGFKPFSCKHHGEVLKIEAFEIGRASCRERV